MGNSHLYGSAAVENCTLACCKSANQITASDLATLMTLSAWLGGKKGLNISKILNFHQDHLTLKEVREEKNRKEGKKMKAN